MCVFVTVIVAIAQLHLRDPTHNASARLRGWPVSQWFRDEAVQADGAVSLCTYIITIVSGTLSCSCSYITSPFSHEVATARSSARWDDLKARCGCSAGSLAGSFGDAVLKGKLMDRACDCKIGWEDDMRYTFTPVCSPCASIQLLRRMYHISTSQARKEPW